jgi:hypothetical protein
VRESINGHGVSLQATCPLKQSGRAVGSAALIGWSISGPSSAAVQSGGRSVVPAAPHSTIYDFPRLLSLTPAVRNENLQSVWFRTPEQRLAVLYSSARVFRVIAACLQIPGDRLRISLINKIINNHWHCSPDGRKPPLVRMRGRWLTCRLNTLILSILIQQSEPSG